MNFKKTDKKNKVVENTTLLYLYTFAKIIFPLITLPYLTRVLSINTYGIVSFVKAYMVYIQIFIDFGFILSSVKEIVHANEDKEKIGLIVGHTILSKIILSFISLIITLLLIFTMDILKVNLVFTLISLLAVVASSFLLDFLFRGIERMKIFAFSFILMKSISTGLIILLVKNDSNVLLIPILDLLSSFAAIVYTWQQVKGLEIRIRITSIKHSLSMIKQSTTYFFSNIATTAFGAFNTILIGIVMTNDQIAIWSVALYVIAAILALYTPIVDGIYPHMIRTKSLQFIKKTLMIFMPIVLGGSILLYFLSNLAISIFAGEQYDEAVVVLKLLIPVLIFSFPAMILGWPSLGVIRKEKEVMISTVITAVVQILGLLVIAYIGKLSLVIVAIYRSSTELLMLGIRAWYVIKFRDEFKT